MLFAKLDNGGCPQYVMALWLVNNAVVFLGQEQKLLFFRRFDSDDSFFQSAVASFEFLYFIIKRLCLMGK